MSLRPPGWLRLLGGAALLAVLGYLVDVGLVGARLASMEPGWVGAALGVTVLQTVLSAWRWRFTVGRLAMRLPLTRAAGEYYRGVFLNQVLPGGVLGDASRAWRHAAREREERGGAVRAVLLERISGQVVMAAFAAASFLVLAARFGAVRGWAIGGAVAVLALAGAVGLALARSAAPTSAVGAFLRDARVTLFARDAFAPQLVTSSLIVGSYVVAYLFAARAVGVDTGFLALAPLVPPVLLAMLVPLSVGGWGLREGAAASLWALAGLGAAEGVAVSVAYGLIVFVGTLPGGYLLAFGGLRSRPRGEGGRDAARAPRSRSKRTSAPSTK